MKTGNFLQDIIGSIVSTRNLFGDAGDERPIEELCNQLLANGGEVSSKRIGSAILKKYQELGEDEKIAFFTYLTEELDLDGQAVAEVALQYNEDKTSDNLERLLDVAEPPRQELLRRMNRVSGATQALVCMRADLLSHLRDHTELKRTDLDFQHLLASWFNRGFLELRRVSWQSPANVLAKIIQYEAVHAINDWNDLKRRLEPADRRCYSFFHPSMPDEPLVFVEIALCKGIPKSVQSVLDENRETLTEQDADTAVFYSISNCQKGLRGVSFGNSLIKQVATDLSAEIPNLKNFVTLSPIPGLSRWVEGEPDTLPEGLSSQLTDAQAAALNENDELELNPYENELKIVAGKYFLEAKRDDGLPLDPVARFHLGNGASVHKVHAMADISKKGIQQSYGLMVNYLYDMSKTETYHEDFAARGIVHSSKELKALSNGKLVSIADIAKAG